MYTLLIPQYYTAKNGRKSKKHFVLMPQISSCLAEPQTVLRSFTLNVLIYTREK